MARVRTRRIVWTALLVCAVLAVLASAGVAQARMLDAPSREIGVDEFIITASAGSGGSIDPTGDVTVPLNGSQSFTITPDATYHIEDVLVDGASQGPITTYLFEAVSAGHTIEATFALDTYTVTPSVVGGAGGHGTISPATQQTVDHGATPAFSFDPDPGYHVQAVRVDGALVTPTPTTSYTFPAVTASHTISVEFAIDTYTVTPSVVGGAGGHGTISPATQQTVDHGATPAFSFDPDPGYHVQAVRVDGALVTPTPTTSYTFPAVTASHTISVEFAIDTYTVTPSVVGGAGGHGTISPATQQTVDHGATPAFSFDPDPGYHVQAVRVDGALVTPTPTTSYTFPAVTASHTISVEFAIDTYTITASAGAHGSVSPAGQSIVEHGGSLTVSILPDASYRVADVEVDGDSLGPLASYTFSDVAADHTVSAAFELGLETILDLDVDAATVSYGRWTTIRGVLAQREGATPIVGGSVALWAADGPLGPWDPVGEPLTTSGDPGAEGKVSVRVKPEASTYYSLRYSPDQGTDLAAAISPTVRVKVRPALGKPGRPAAVKAGKRFTVAGKLAPRFEKGSASVQVRIYRLKGGNWRPVKRAAAAVAASGDASRYSVRLKLKTRGTYRFRAEFGAAAGWASAVSQYSGKLRVR